MIKTWSTEGFTFRLERPEKDRNLQAWDAADTYLLEHIVSLSLPDSHRILVLNDRWGALSMGLQRFDRAVVTDSFLSSRFIQKNAELNGIHPPEILELEDAAQRHWDLVVFRLPSAPDLLRYQLRRLAVRLKGVLCLGGGMTRNIHTSTLALLEETAAPVTSTRARRKARLFSGIGTGQTEEPAEKLVHSYPLADYGIELFCRPGCFSANRLDPGTAFFLERMDWTAFEGVQRVLDLGCGNGVLGIRAALAFPEAGIVFTDDSKVALESVALGWNKANLSSRFSCFHTDVFPEENEDLFDLILCNPPFHRDGSVSVETAFRMIGKAAVHLKTGGSFFLVANRHLGYHKWMEEVFGLPPRRIEGERFQILITKKN